MLAACEVGAFIAIGSKLGFDATRKLAGEGFQGEWPPLIAIDAAVKARVDGMFRGNRG